METHGGLRGEIDRAKGRLKRRHVVYLHIGQGSRGITASTPAGTVQNRHIDATNQARRFIPAINGHYRGKPRLRAFGVRSGWTLTGGLTFPQEALEVGVERRSWDVGGSWCWKP